MRGRAVAFLAGSLLLAGCAQPGTAVGVDEPAVAASVPPGRYRAVATVLESPEHGPQLCHSVADSLPPQCGGPDVAGWSWESVAHESANGTRWGSYAVVGTFDGTRFTLTEPARVATADQPADVHDLTSPCPAPAGGWRPLDRARASDAAMQAAIARATGMPGFAGLWLDQNGGENDPARLVLNVRFTGDPVSRQAALREVWGGALCLGPAKHSQADLERVQTELTGTPGMLSSGIDVVGNRVDLMTLVATPRQQADLDRRYGAGAVRLTGWLRPA
jgi:hypothetical protein